jgi:hypothetical protein
MVTCAVSGGGGPDGGGPDGGGGVPTGGGVGADGGAGVDPPQAAAASQTPTAIAASTRRITDLNVFTCPCDPQSMPRREQPIHSDPLQFCVVSTLTDLAGGWRDAQQG